MTTATRKMILPLMLAGMVALISCSLEGSDEQDRGEQHGRPGQAPSPVSVVGGETVITVDRATQAKSGIAGAPLAVLRHRGELRATGTVLQLERLFEARSSYADARARTERSRASLAAYRAEYERLRLLNAADRNVSDKSLQAARAAWRAEEATFQGATASLEAVSGSVRQRWGNAIAGWIFEGSPRLQRLVLLKDLLLQVTLPPGADIGAAPPTIQVQASEHAPSVPARLISPAPATDPRLQVSGFFYLAPPRNGLQPGMNVLARLPAGPLLTGVVIPASAVVWWQGRAWAYLQSGADRFVRREIPTTLPVQNGYFVATGPTGKDRVVVRGAQLLLSEELRPRVPSGGETGEGDND